jgi:hypothetical protein
MPIVDGAEEAIIRREYEFHAVEETEDGRWYIIAGERLMSVTTAFNAIAKRGLVDWSGMLAAALAFDELPTLNAAARRRPCERTSVRCEHGPDITCGSCPCRVCRPCVQKWLAKRHVRESSRRADEGVRVHDVAEWWTVHGEIKDHDEDIAPYVRSFREFVTDYGLTPDDVLLAEAIVINREIGAAGQTDGIIRFHADRSVPAAKLISRLTQVRWQRAQKLRLTADLIVDWKTREKDEPKLYPEMAMQLSGYRHFPVVRIKNSDVEEPLQRTDGGLIVQFRPDGYTARPVVCDEHTYENGFLNALRLYQWITEDGAAAVSSRTFVLPETVADRARKAARAQAAADAEQPTAQPTEPATAAA